MIDAAICSNLENAEQIFLANEAQLMHKRASFRTVIKARCGLLRRALFLACEERRLLCRRSCATGDWLGSGVQSSLTFPQTKPTSANEANGKTIVKTVFGHERHDAWPNEPDLSAIARSILAKRTQGGASSGRYLCQTNPRRCVARGSGIARLWNSLSTGPRIWPLNLGLKNHCKFSVVYNDR